LFEKENGREILERLINSVDVNEAIKKYSNIVLHNLENYKNSSASSSAPAI
jgi:hypothetical protein